MSFGANLKYFREKAGFSQDSLAKKCCISQQTIGAIEQEIRMPSLSLALAIARVLGTSVEDLADDTVQDGALETMENESK